MEVQLRVPYLLWRTCHMRVKLLVNRRNKPIETSRHAGFTACARCSRVGLVASKLNLFSYPRESPSEHGKKTHRSAS